MSFIHRPIKSSNGGIGGGGKKKIHKLNAHGKTKRGAEEKVLRLMRALIIQEYHEATGISVSVLNHRELDHIHGRNAPGYVPLNAILSPLNLQLITKEQHAEKTNPTSGSGISDRQDFRETDIQERMVSLNRRLLKKLDNVPTLKEIEAAIETEIYAHHDDCQYCVGKGEVYEESFDRS